MLDSIFALLVLELVGIIVKVYHLYYFRKQRYSNSLQSNWWASSGLAYSAISQQIQHFCTYIVVSYILKFVQFVPNVVNEKWKIKGHSSFILNGKYFQPTCCLPFVQPITFMSFILSSSLISAIWIMNCCNIYAKDFIYAFIYCIKLLCAQNSLLQINLYSIFPDFINKLIKSLNCFAFMCVTSILQVHSFSGNRFCIFNSSKILLSVENLLECNFTSLFCNSFALVNVQDLLYETE